ncbi:MAG: hypothetical protein H6729_11795 [Deltaproteobacteria bacterium]|nr:hypothetical protein [Deltaproteobacteria bacterium]
MTSTIEQTFNDLAWHDAIILQLTVDRGSPGENDEILLAVEWPDGTQQQIRFVDCYLLEAQMNFGVVAPESIRDARCSNESSKLGEVRQRWESLGVTLGDLQCFEVYTNSTASIIRICARGFQVEHGGGHPLEAMGKDRAVARDQG